MTFGLLSWLAPLQTFALVTSSKLGLQHAMAISKWNDQKVVGRAHAKAQHEWDELVIVANDVCCCPNYL